MRKFHLALATLPLLVACGPARAAITQTATFSGLNLAIPDGNASGLADARVFTSAITSIESVEVSVDIAGTFNGDLYAYLTNGSGFAVLLNRTGVTGGNAFGYDNDGFSVAFSDTAANGDIPTYQTLTNPGTGVAVSGLWQPDARAVDPSVVTDGSVRSAFLSSFNGSSADGLWTLYVADMVTGDAHVLTGWSVTVTGVPEPGSLGLLALGLATALVRRRSA